MTKPRKHPTASNTRRTPLRTPPTTPSAPASTAARLRAFFDSVTHDPVLGPMLHPKERVGHAEILMFEDSEEFGKRFLDTAWESIWNVFRNTDLLIEKETTYDFTPEANREMGVLLGNFWDSCRSDFIVRVALTLDYIPDMTADSYSTRMVAMVPQMPAETHQEYALRCARAVRATMARDVELKWLIQNAPPPTSGEFGAYIQNIPRMAPDEPDFNYDWRRNVLLATLMNGGRDNERVKHEVDARHELIARDDGLGIFFKNSLPQTLEGVTRHVVAMLKKRYMRLFGQSISYYDEEMARGARAAEIRGSYLAAREDHKVHGLALSLATNQKASRALEAQLLRVLKQTWREDSAAYTARIRGVMELLEDDAADEYARRKMEAVVTIEMADIDEAHEEVFDLISSVLQARTHADQKKLLQSFEARMLWPERWEIMPLPSYPSLLDYIERKAHGIPSVLRDEIGDEMFEHIYNNDPLFDIVLQLATGTIVDLAEQLGEDKPLVAKMRHLVASRAPAIVDVMYLIIRDDLVSGMLNQSVANEVADIALGSEVVKDIEKNIGVIVIPETYKIDETYAHMVALHALSQTPRAGEVNAMVFATEYKNGKNVDRNYRALADATAALDDRIRSIRRVMLKNLWDLLLGVGDNVDVHSRIATFTAGDFYPGFFPDPNMSNVVPLQLTSATDAEPATTTQAGDDDDDSSSSSSSEPASPVRAPTSPLVSSFAARREPSDAEQAMSVIARAHARTPSDVLLLQTQPAPHLPTPQPQLDLLNASPTADIVAMASTPPVVRDASAQGSPVATEKAHVPEPQPSSSPELYSPPFSLVPSEDVEDYGYPLPSSPGASPMIVTEPAPQPEPAPEERGRKRAGSTTYPYSVELAPRAVQPDPDAPAFMAPTAAQAAELANDLDKWCWHVDVPVPADVYESVRTNAVEFGTPFKAEVQLARKMTDIIQTAGVLWVAPPNVYPVPPNVYPTDEHKPPLWISLPQYKAEQKEKASEHSKSLEGSILSASSLLLAHRLFPPAALYDINTWTLQEPSASQETSFPEIQQIAYFMDLLPELHMPVFLTLKMWMHRMSLLMLRRCDADVGRTRAVLTPADSTPEFPVTHDIGSPLHPATTLEVNYVMPILLTGLLVRRLYRRELKPLEDWNATVSAASHHPFRALFVPEYNAVIARAYNRKVMYDVFRRAYAFTTTMYNSVLAPSIDNMRMLTDIIHLLDLDFGGLHPTHYPLHAALCDSFQSARRWTYLPVDFSWQHVLMVRRTRGVSYVHMVEQTQALHFAGFVQVAHQLAAPDALQLFCSGLANFAGDFDRLACMFLHVDSAKYAMDGDVQVPSAFIMVDDIDTMRNDNMVEEGMFAMYSAELMRRYLLMEREPARAVPAPAAPVPAAPASAEPVSVEPVAVEPPRPEPAPVRTHVSLSKRRVTEEEKRKASQKKVEQLKPAPAKGTRASPRRSHVPEPPVPEPPVPAPVQPAVQPAPEPVTRPRRPPPPPRVPDIIDEFVLPADTYIASTITCASCKTSPARQACEKCHVGYCSNICQRMDMANNHHRVCPMYKQLAFENIAREPELQIHLALVQSDIVY